MADDDRGLDGPVGDTAGHKPARSKEARGKKKSRDAERAPPEAQVTGPSAAAAAPVAEPETDISPEPVPASEPVPAPEPAPEPVPEPVAVPPPAPPPVEMPEPGAFQARLMSAGELALIAPGLTIASLGARLTDTSPVVRANAALALGVTGPSASAMAGHLGPALRDTNRDVRLAAARAMGMLGPAGVRASAPALIKALEDMDPDVVSAARDALAALLPASIPALVESLDLGPDLADRRITPVLLKAGSDAAPGLVKGLESRSALVRANAARLLGRLGPEVAGIAREPLFKLSTDPDRTARNQATKALRIIDGLGDGEAKETVPVPAEIESRELTWDEIGGLKLDPSVLERTVSDGRSVVKINSARALAKAGRCPDGMALLLKDSDAAVRRAAVESILALGMDATRAAPWLFPCLADRDDAVRGGAMKALLGMFDAADAAMIEGLRIDTERAEATVLQVFKARGFNAVDTLVRGLKHSSALVRMNSARGLAILARNGADRAVPDLDEATHDLVREVGAAAREALDEIVKRRPKPPPEFVPEPPPIPGFAERFMPAGDLASFKDARRASRLVDGLLDRSEVVRANAATTLGVLGPDAGPMVRNLVAAVKDESPAVRMAVAWALGHMGEEVAMIAGRGLTTALPDPDKGVAEQARESLRNLGDAAMPALVNALDVGVHIAGRTVVPLLVEAGPRAVGALVAGLKDGDPLIRTNSARCLGLLGRETAAVARGDLVAIGADPDRQVRAEVARAIRVIDGTPEPAKYREPAPLPAPGFDEIPMSIDDLRGLGDALKPDALERAVLDGRPRVRANSARALGMLGIPSPGLPLLLRDAEVDVRRAATQAYVAMGPEGHKAAPWLLTALADKDEAVSEGAVLALAGMFDAARPAIVEGLRQDPEDAARTVLRVFEQVGFQSVQVLAGALRHNSALVRMNAAAGLAMLARHGADQALPALEEALTDPIQEVRVSVASAIDAVVRGRPRPVVELVPPPPPIPGYEDRLLQPEEIAAHPESFDPGWHASRLQDGRSWVRANAAAVLGLAGASAAEQAPWLTASMKDPAVEVRLAAARAMGMMGPVAGKVAGPALVSGLRDMSPEVAAACRESLAAMGTACLPALVDGLDLSADQADRLVIPLLPVGAPEVLGALIGGLTHESSLVRANAARCLALLGRERAVEARSALVAASTDPEKTVRAEVGRAIRVLDGIKEPPIVLEPIKLPAPDFDRRPYSIDEMKALEGTYDSPVLDRAILDGRSQVRANAARALAAEGRFTEGLALLLRDSDTDVRRAAIGALKHLGTAGAAAARWLLSALLDRDEETREGAISALAAMFEPAKPVLVEGLRTDPEEAPITILLAFYEAGFQSVAVLAEALKHSSALVRINAAEGLRMLASRGADRAIGDLEVALNDPVKEVRLAAASAIDEIARKRPRPPATFLPEPPPIEGFEERRLAARDLRRQKDALVLNRLVRGLQGTSEVVRINAATAIGVMGAEAAAAAAWLAVALRDDSVEVRVAAAAAIGEVGPLAARSAAPALVAALRDVDPRVVEAARSALRKLGPAALPALVDGLDLGTEMAERTVIPLLPLAGGVAVEALVGALSHVSPLVRANAARCLGLFGPERGSPARAALVTAGADADKSVRVEVARAIRILDGLPESPLVREPSPLPLKDFDRRPFQADELLAAASGLDANAMERALLDGRAVVRANAARAMGVMGRHAAALALLIRDADHEVARAAAGALEALGPAAAGSAMWLVGALDGRDDLVRESSIRALTAMFDEALPFIEAGLRTDPDTAPQRILRVFEGVGHKAVEPLIGGLTHDSPLVRINSARGLGMLADFGAERAIDDLEAALKDTVKDVRSAAAAALDAIVRRRRPRPAHVPEPPPIEGFEHRRLTIGELEARRDALDVVRLAARLQDRSEVVRINVARGLGVLGTEAATAASWLAAALGDDSAEVRTTVASALAAIGPRAARHAAGALVSCLRDNDGNVAREARGALESMGVAAVGALCDGLDLGPDLAERTVVPLMARLGAEAVPGLMAALTHSEALVRANAARCLGRLGPDAAAAARPALVAAGADPKKQVRVEVAAAIRKIDRLPEAKTLEEPLVLPAPEFAVRRLDADELRKMRRKLDPDALERALFDGREHVRANAALALGVLGRPAAGLPLLLRDSSAEVRRSASMAFEDLGPAGGRAAPWLVAALSDSDGEVRASACRALVAMFDEALPALAAGLRTDTEKAPDTILQVFAGAEERALDSLIGALRHESPLVRANAAAGLGMLARFGAERAIFDLESLLEDPVKEVRTAAARTIDRIVRARKRPTPTFLPARVPIEGFEDRLVSRDELVAQQDSLDAVELAGRLRDPVMIVRLNAAGGLGVLGPAAETATAWMASALADDVAEVRAAVAEALGAIGPGAARMAGGALVACLRDPSPDVVRASGEALSAMGTAALPALVNGLDMGEDLADRTVVPIIGRLGAGAVPALVGALTHSEALVRTNAARCLAAVGTGAAEARGALVAASADGDKRVRAEVARAIRVIDGLPERPALLDPIRLPAPDFHAREYTVEELAGLGRKLDQCPLEKAILDGRPRVRANAARALGARGRHVAGMALLLRDSENEVRRGAAEAFVALGEAAAASARWIVAALSDRDEGVRDHAVAALVKMYDVALADVEWGLRTDPDTAREGILRVFLGTRQKGVEPLRRGLASSVSIIRINAALGLEMLAHHGAERAIEELEAALKDPVKDVRVAAAGAIDEIVRVRKRATPVFAKEPPVIEGFSERRLTFEELQARVADLDKVRLSDQLQDRSEWVRVNAATALGVIGPEAASVTAWLAAALRDESPAVREAVATALASVGPAAVRLAGGALTACLHDQSPVVVEAARTALRAMGIAAMKALVDGLDRGTELADRTVIPLILDLGEQAIPGLVGALSHSETVVRANAARCLGRLGSAALAVRPSLVAAGADPDRKVRAEVARAIRLLDGLPEPETVREPIPLPVEGFDSRPMDMDELKGISDRLDPGVMTRALLDGRPVVRANAATALALIGQAPDGLPLLLRDSDPAVRKAAARAIETIGPAAARHATWLVAAMGERDDEVRETSIRALIGIFDEARQAVEAGLRSDPDRARDGILLVFQGVEGRGVDPLVAGLGHSSALVRINAARGLGMLARYGADRTIADLEAVLKDPVKDVRVAAAEAIDEIIRRRRRPAPTFAPEEAPIDGFDARVLTVEEFAAHTLDPVRMATRLQDRSEVVRINAANAIGTIGPPAAGVAPWLAAALGDDSVEVRRASAKALSALGPAAARAAGGALVACLHDMDGRLVDLASAAIRSMGAAAVPALVNGLDLGADLADRRIVPLLADTGDASVGALVAALTHSESLVRANAARCLGRLGPSVAGWARGALVAAGADPDKRVRAEVSRAIRAIDGQPEPVLVREPMSIPIPAFEHRPYSVEELHAMPERLDPAIMELGLLDGRPVVRANAARALGVLGRPAAGLSLLLRDSEVEVRRAAAEAFATLGPAAAGAAQWLLISQGDRDQTVREFVLKALAGMFDEALPAIVAGLRTDPGEAPRTVLRVFEEVEGRGVDPLIPALRHESPLVRTNAARGLGMLARTGGDRAFPDLEEALKDNVKDVRLAAAEAIDAFLRARRGRAATLLEPKKPPVPGFADKPLGFDAFKGAVKRLVPAELTAWLQDGREVARANAATAFGVLGNEAVSHAGWLAAALRDSSPLVREAAANAFARIGPASGGVGGHELLTCLFDRNERVAGAARTALKCMGPAAVPALVAGLDLGTDLADRHVIPLLPTEGPEVVNALADALSSMSPLTRANAARCLGNLGPVQAAPARMALVKTGADEDRAVRREVARAIRVIDGVADVSPVREPTPLPRPDFADRVLTRVEIEKVLKDLDQGLLERCLGDGRPVVRANAVLALGLSGRPVQGMVALVRDSEVEVRRAAAAAYEALGPAGAAAAPWLVTTLADRDTEVRASAARAVAAMFDEARPAILEGLRADPAEAAGTVLLAFEEVGHKGVDLLMDGLSHASPLVRVNAAQGLGLLASKGAERAFEKLEQALRDPVKDVRLAAAAAIDEIIMHRHRPAPVFEPEPPPIEGFEERVLTEKDLSKRRDALRPIHLANRLHDPREVVRINAANGLGVLGPEAVPAASWLAAAVRDASVPVRIAAAAAMARLGPAAAPAAGPALVGTLRDLQPGDDDAARAALRALGPAVIPSLINALDFAPFFADREVIPHLVELGEAAVPALTLAISHSSALVRANAARCISRMPPGVAEPARSALVAVGRDADRSVRAEAAKAMRALDGLPEAPAVLEPPTLPVPGFDSRPLTFDELAKAGKGLKPDVMVPLMRNGRPLVRGNAARALAVAAGKTPAQPVIDELVLALKDGDVTVRIAAAEALGRLGKDPERVAPALALALKRAPEALETAALSAVDALGPTAVGPLLKALSARPDEVEDTLGRIVAKRPKAFVMALCETAETSPNPVVQENAVDLIRKLGHEASAAEPALLAMTDKARGLLQVKAVQAVAEVARPTKEVLDRLTALKRGFVTRSLVEAIDLAMKRLKQRMPRNV